MFKIKRGKQPGYEALTDHTIITKQHANSEPASIGYKAKEENIATESTDIIFDKTNFLSAYSNDIVNASREIPWFLCQQPCQ